jgi:hypothetical protein
MSGRNSMPAFSMTARRPSTGGSVGPGPGSYEIKEFASSTGFTVGNASRDSRNFSSGPGPAHYSIKTRGSRAVVIGTSKRKFSLTGEEVPGPGSYEIRPIKDGPQYSLRLKNEEKPKYFVPVFYN